MTVPPIVAFNRIGFHDEVEPLSHPVRSGMVDETKSVFVIQILHYRTEAYKLTTKANLTATHDSIQVVGYCVHEEKFYLLLDSIDVVAFTPTLRDAAQQLTPPEWISQVVTWCSQIATALTRFRRKGFVAVNFSVQNLLECSGSIVVISSQVLHLESTTQVLGCTCSTAGDIYCMGQVVQHIIASRIRSPRLPQAVFPVEYYELFNSLLDVNCRRTLSDIIASLSNHPQCIPWSRLGDWLRSGADECPTLTEAVQKLADTYEVPPTRRELRSALVELQKVDLATILLGHADDLHAIKLYTENSPVYKLVNAFLTSSSNGDHFDAAPVKALFKKMYRSARELGRPVGPIKASRFVACNNSWTRLQLEHNATCFKVGAVLPIYQFESYTLADDLPEFNVPNTPRIIYRCSNLMGYNVSGISRFLAEQEVLVLPPAWFTVKSVARHHFPNGVLEYVEVEVDYSDRPP